MATRKLDTHNSQRTNTEGDEKHQEKDWICKMVIGVGTKYHQSKQAFAVTQVDVKNFNDKLAHKTLKQMV